MASPSQEATVGCPQGVCIQIVYAIPAVPVLLVPSVHTAPMVDSKSGTTSMTCRG